MHSSHFGSGSRQPLVGGIRRLSWDFQVKKWHLNYLGLILASAFRLEMMTELQNMTAQPIETHDSVCSLRWLLWGGIHSSLPPWFPENQSLVLLIRPGGLAMKCSELFLAIKYLVLLLLCDLRICWGPTGLLGTVSGRGCAISQHSRWCVLDAMPSASARMAVV